MLQQNTSQFEVSFWNTKIVWIFIRYSKIMAKFQVFCWNISSSTSLFISEEWVFCMIIFWNNNNVLSIKKVIFSPSIQHYFFLLLYYFLQMLLFQQKMKSKSGFICELFMRFIIKDEKCWICTKCLLLLDEIFDKSDHRGHEIYPYAYFLIQLMQKTHLNEFSFENFIFWKVVLCNL